MTQTLEQLGRRTGTLRSIGGVVRTMKIMAAINAAPFEHAARAIDAYRDTVLDGIHAFLRCNGAPTFAARDAWAGDEAEEVVVAFGSDHGLCGNYNEAVAEEVVRHRADRLVCIGAQLQDALAGVGRAPEATLLPPASVDGLGRLSGQLTTRLEDMRAAAASGALAVTLVHTTRREHGRQAPVALRLLPLDPALLRDLAQRRWPSRSLPQVGPAPARMLSALVREFLFASLFRASAEAMLTENAARLARMQQAEQLVDDRLEELLAQTRAVRQDEITTELLDVITGFETLEARRRGSRRKAKERQAIHATQDRPGDPAAGALARPR